MNQKSLRLFLSITVLFITYNTAYATWTNFITNYTRNDYGAGSQNWQIIQGNNYWMYFANKMGVLEFNGKDWQLYSLENRSDVRSIFKSNDNRRIYLGGVNELGYLEPNAIGEMKYHCLSKEMSKEQLSFGNIWGIYENDKTVYFCADHLVAKYVDSRFTLIYSPDKIDCSNLINNTLYIGTPSGVYVLAGDSFYKMEGSELLENKKIRAIIPFHGKILIATALDGLYTLTGKNFRQFETDADNFIKQSEIFSIAVNDEYIAIGTVLKGVVITDHQGHLLKYMNESHGLQNNTILSLLFDKNKNLWLGLDNGIGHIALNSPLTNLYAAPNFYGAGYAAALFENKLYLGTNRGLYYTQWPVSSTESPPVLNLIEKAQGQVWDMNNVGGDLLCSLDKGLYVIDGDNTALLENKLGVWSCRPMINDSLAVWISTYNGLLKSKKKNGKWENPVSITNFSESVIHFEEESPGVLWYRNNWNEVSRVSMNDSLNKVVQISNFTTNDGSPENAYVCRYNKNVIFCSSQGFYSYSDEKSFYPSTEVNNLVDEKNLSWIYSHENGDNLWLLGNERIGLYNKKNKKRVTFQHNLPLIANFEKLIPVNDSLVIICNENGFALWNANYDKQPENSGQMQVISVEIIKPSDSLVYVSNINQKKYIPEIAYNHNSLNFRYGLIDYASQSQIKYRYRMDGQAWSEFITYNVKEYRDLSIGKHTFTVETLLEDGTSLSDNFSFVILPPWYRTYWAYIIYCMSLILLLTGIWYFDDVRIKKKERQIEFVQKREMQEREAMYLEQAKQKEKEIINLKNEHLELEVKHKSQELAHITINLVRKNEMLIEIKDELTKILAGLRSTDASTGLQRQVLRLNTRVNENILQDDSLKKFEEHFDLVHNNFMKRLKQKYPALTITERKMCAFIKMQLSSKEIAPLLNISIRGTETIRYRLRKKLGLNREDSLSFFLNNF